MALMPEPVQGGDETVAQDVGKTVAVPNPTPTEAVDLAWSGNDDDHNDRADRPGAVRQSWSSTWGRAGVLVAASLALAGAIVLTSWLLSAPDQAAGNGSGPAGKSVAHRLVIREGLFASLTDPIASVCAVQNKGGYEVGVRNLDMIR